jgi:hypothetical protein
VPLGLGEGANVVVVVVVVEVVVVVDVDVVVEAGGAEGGAVVVVTGGGADPPLTFTGGAGITPAGGATNVVVVVVVTGALTLRFTGLSFLVLACFAWVTTWRGALVRARYLATIVCGGAFTGGLALTGTANASITGTQRVRASQPTIPDRLVARNRFAPDREPCQNSGSRFLSRPTTACPRG